MLKPVSAVDLARDLGVDPKRFRAWLRSKAAARNPHVEGHELNDRWTFTEDEASELARLFREDGSTLSPSSPQLLASRTTKEWFWEGNVQTALLRHLKEDGWHIQSSADTATRRRGIDVVAERNGSLLAIEVKGYPSVFYSRGPRAGEPKPTRPRLQARHWFAEALRAAIAVPSVLPSAQIAVAFPDMERFRELVEVSSWALERLGISVYFVGEDGSVATRLSITQKERRT